MMYYPYIIAVVVIVVLIIIAAVAYFVHTPGSYLTTIASMVGIGTIIATMTIAYCNTSLQHNAHDQLKRNNTRKANMTLIHRVPEDEKAAVSIFNYWQDNIVLAEHSHSDPRSLYHRLVDIDYHSSYIPIWNRHRNKYDSVTQTFGDAFNSQYPTILSYEEFQHLSM